MTRKDYVMIAQVFEKLNDDFNNGGEDTVSLALVVEELAMALKNDNPRFDMYRFLDACNVNN